MQQLSQKYADYLLENPNLNLEDICLTVNLGRSHFNQRLAFTATSTKELQTKLNQFIDRENPAEFWQGKANLNHKPKVTVVNSPDVQSSLLELATSMLINPIPNRETAEVCWEISTRSSLQPSNNQTVIFTKINHELDDWQLLTSGLAQLYILGVAINWKTVAKNFGGNRIILPTYPFQRQTYWLD